MDADQLERALQLACAVATCPSVQLLAAFRSDDLSVATKADGSPVTRTDREAEAAMRAQLRASLDWLRELFQPELQVAADLGGIPVGPGAFDQDASGMRVTGFGDRPLTPPLAAGIC